MIVSFDAQTVYAVGLIVTAVCTVANNFMTYRLQVRQTEHAKTTEHMHSANQAAIGTVVTAVNGQMAEMHKEMMETVMERHE